MKNLPASNFQVLTPQEFLDDTLLEAKSAKHRIWAQAMEVDPTGHTSQLLDTLEEKAKQGLNSRLHIDYYTLLITNGSFNYMMRLHKALSKDKHIRIARKIYFERLMQNGVKILYTNPPGILEKIFPFKGRNHMKIVVIDNAAWIGGVNFNEWNLKANDFMVKITDPKIVSHIASLYKKIDREEPFDDYKIQCNDETTLLVDSGKIGKSIILKTALNLTDNAENSIFMTTAFFPDTQMVKSLHTLHKKHGDVKVIAPTPRSLSGIYVLVEKLNYEISRWKKLQFPTKMIRTPHHAKLLIVDRKVAMFGSHNFSGRGVTLGTGEVAIKTTNPTLIKNLLYFFEETHKKS